MMSKKRLENNKNALGVAIDTELLERCIYTHAISQPRKMATWQYKPMTNKELSESIGIDNNTITAMRKYGRAAQQTIDKFDSFANINNLFVKSSKIRKWK